MEPLSPTFVSLSLRRPTRNCRKSLRASDSHLLLRLYPMVSSNESGLAAANFPAARQGLAIARALLQQHRVLILDEATSCLDPGAEEFVLHNIRRNLSASTLIVISHRLTTFATFTRVLILSSGRIIRDGGPGAVMFSPMTATVDIISHWQSQLEHSRRVRYHHLTLAVLWESRSTLQPFRFPDWQGRIRAESQSDDQSIHRVAGFRSLWRALRGGRSAHSKVCAVISPEVSREEGDAETALNSIVVGTSI
jgi:hypothetical protein